MQWLRVEVDEYESPFGPTAGWRGYLGTGTLVHVSRPDDNDHPYDICHIDLDSGERILVHRRFMRII